MYALITGASGGIGFELARVFAASGYNLLLASSNRERLEAARDAIRREYSGTDIRLYQSDLARMGAAQELYEAVMADRVSVDVLVNNAGFGLAGRSREIPEDREIRLMVLNMITPVILCKRALSDMAARKSGMILNIASTAAFQPGPYSASYFAGKAFLLSYSRAVRRESAEDGVRVCTVCPGATNTGFFEKEGMAAPRSAARASSVARFAYHCLMRNRETGIPGIRNRIMQLAPEALRIGYVSSMKSKPHAT